MRLLGLRHIAQALLSARYRSRTARRLGAAVDGLHAATDVVCALVDRRRARPACIDAAVAIALGAGTLATGRQLPR
ncbi:MAG: hypothetical protein ACR2HY_08745 [Acidimicrobiales bacterium]